MLAVFVVAAIVGGAESVVDTSSMALVTAVVDESQLERAGGAMSATELIANSLVGPPLGGLLFALAIAVPFGFDAVSFLIAALIMAMACAGCGTTACCATSRWCRSCWAFVVLTWNVLTTALRQRLVPDHLLGRVMASYRFFVLAAMPLGAAWRPPSSSRA